MVMTLRKAIAGIAIMVAAIIATFTLQVSNAPSASANLILCVTHFDRQPGPTGYHSHTTGNFVDGTDYKIVQYFKAGPGYIYLAKTVRRWCG